MGGRNVLIHRPTHPLPLISLPAFTALLHWEEAEGQGVGYRRLQEAPLPISFCGKPLGVVHTPRQLAPSNLPAQNWWGAQRGVERSCEFRETPGCGRGRRVPSPGAGRSWNAAARSPKGLSAGEAATSSETLPAANQLLGSHLPRRQVQLDFSQKSRRETTSGTGSEGRGKVEKRGSTSRFTSLNRGSESAGICPRRYWELAAHSTSGFAAFWVQFPDLVSPSGRWNISENLLTTETKAVGKSPYTTKGLGGNDVLS